ncbi:Peptidase family M48 [Mariprofundus ferrinatatus]|uniref:Peptidase family M48 n=1 Tax=Mariprofundus ferrinatatus TaxID=1921087 RepID=A0A2K8L4G6_9PROT|nr:M48 family metalloprotease [Mariprofundus ferrinatatus]ATX82133.1 Peptidase family M48 [Mariprofundus ferrinatatus]
MNKRTFVLLTMLLLPASISHAFDFSFEDLQNIDVGKVIEFGQTASKAVRSFSDEERYYIGRASGARLLSNHRLLGRAALQEYVSAIGQTLAMASGRPEVYAGYHFIVLDEPQRVNAYAVPGGFIFITTGLIAKTRNEDELAAVLAHEISHIVLDHPVGSIKKQYRDKLMRDILSEASERYASEKVKKLAELAGGLNNLSGLLVDFAAKGYSRAKEQDADMVALTILRTAGYDPTRFPHVLSRLSAIGSGISGTHGNPRERAGAVTQRLSRDVPVVVRERNSRYLTVMTQTR